MFSFLRNYRATPHCTTDYAPATVLLGRPIGIKILTVNAKVTDRFDPNLMRENDMKKIKQNAENQRCIKEWQINVGDSVLVKQRKENKFSQPFGCSREK